MLQWRGHTAAWLDIEKRGSKFVSDYPRSLCNVQASLPQYHDTSGSVFSEAAVRVFVKFRAAQRIWISCSRV
jgi:hypothetical protein